MPAPPVDRRAAWIECRLIAEPQLGQPDDLLLGAALAGAPVSG